MHSIGADDQSQGGKDKRMSLFVTKYALQRKLDTGTTVVPKSSAITESPILEVFNLIH